MKIIDKTPFLSETGQFSFIDRIQAMLKYGPSWFQQLDAQQVVITHLEKQLDNKYTLLRNATLPRSDIVVPLILLGPAGVFVLNVTHLRGVYQAKNDTWGIVEGEKIKPAGVNLLARTARFGRALQVYLKKQGYELENVEAVLVSTDPGLHVDSVRPAVRVVLSDAIERFAATLKQARPVLSSPAIYDLVERIQTPRAQPKPEEQPIAEPVEELPVSSSPYEESAYFAEEPAEAESSAPLWDPEERGFAFQDTSAFEQTSSDASIDDGMDYYDAQPETPSRRKSAEKRGFLGMTTRELLMLGTMGLIQLCLLVVFGVLIYMNNR